MSMLLTALIVSVAIQMVLFIPAYFFRTDKLTDFSYGFSFIALALIALLSRDAFANRIMLFVMIAIWGLRLITYLVIRVIKEKKDVRFDGIREKFVKFFTFWFLQGISVWIILLPTILFLGQQEPETTMLSIWGLLIWILGISIEGIADYQKFKFKNNPANKGKWIQSGLWRNSRHPNYFGEMLCWIGVYLYCLPVLLGSAWQVIVGLISPLYIMSLLLFFTGVPKLEKYADDRWGKDKAYQEYKRRTSVVVLWPLKK